MRATFLVLAASLAIVGCSKPPTSPSTAANNNNDGGSARLDIKHGLDPDAAKINRSPKDISVEDLLATKLPESYEKGRMGEFERSTFRLTGTLKSVIKRKDGDFFLVMQGKSGATAVVEVPDPAQCKGSPMESDIQRTRDDIEKKYHPTDKQKDINQPATVEGVGFYGTGQKRGSGGRGNSARLMPGTGFKSGN